jgi:hypothetical protein
MARAQKSGALPAWPTCRTGGKQCPSDHANCTLSEAFSQGKFLPPCHTNTFSFCILRAPGRTSKLRVSAADFVAIRGEFHGVPGAESRTILCTACVRRYKITPLFAHLGRIFNVSYEKALDRLSRDDRFKATVYAMNTLLIHKGIYTQKEFEQLFVEWASKQSKI